MYSQFMMHGQKNIKLLEWGFKSRLGYACEGYFSQRYVLAEGLRRSERPAKEFLRFLFHGATDPRGPGPSHYRGFTIILRHNTLLWTSDQPDAEIATWQHTRRTTDRHPCPRQDSNLQYLQTHALDRAATGIGSPMNTSN